MLTAIQELKVHISMIGIKKFPLATLQYINELEIVEKKQIADAHDDGIQDPGSYGGVTYYNEKYKINKSMEENTNAETQRNEADAKLRAAAEPLIKYLAENHHPHTMAHVTSNSVQVFEGVHSLQEINDHLVD